MKSLTESYQVRKYCRISILVEQPPSLNDASYADKTTCRRPAYVTTEQAPGPGLARSLPYIIRRQIPKYLPRLRQEGSGLGDQLQVPPTTSLFLLHLPREARKVPDITEDEAPSTAVVKDGGWCYARQCPAMQGSAGWQESWLASRWSDNRLDSGGIGWGGLARWDASRGNENARRRRSDSDEPPRGMDGHGHLLETEK